MIKLFLVDCDSTLTDGIYHTTEDGVISKNFFTRDFHGMYMLNKAGVKVCIITAASDNVIDHQCERAAKYADIIKGTNDKLASVRAKYVDSGLFNWDEIAYIGDDVFDIPLLSEVGLCACPDDAAQEVSDLVFDIGGVAAGGGDRGPLCGVGRTYGPEGFRSTYAGGCGCVREFAEYILRINEAG